MKPTQQQRGIELAQFEEPITTNDRYKEPLNLHLFKKNTQHWTYTMEGLKKKHINTQVLQFQWNFDRKRSRSIWT